MQLPAPFANTATFQMQTISAYDAAGPAWAWSNITLGEHTGTHLDAPVHWITGKDGKAVHQIQPARLVGPAVVIDLSTEAAANPDVLLEPEHLEAWEAQHGPLPHNCWCCCDRLEPAQHRRPALRTLTRAARTPPALQ